MEYCIYYDIKDQSIIDYLPTEIENSVKQNIIEAWGQEITREILKIVSEHGEITAPQIKEAIGHSSSTLHENIKKLEELDLIKTEMIYTGNKKKIIIPKLLCVTKNPSYKARFQNFFQGLFIDSKNSQKIIECLEKNSKKFLSVEEISIKTKIPVDEIEILLKNWDSQITRSLSDFMKQKPFEKKIMYKFKKSK